MRRELQRAFASVAGVVRLTVVALASLVLGQTLAQLLAVRTDAMQGGTSFVVRPAAGADSASLAGELWIYATLADGRLVRFPEDSALPGWSVTQRRGSGMPAQAELDERAPAGAVIVERGPVVAVLDTWQWPGQLAASNPHLGTVALDSVRGTTVTGTEQRRPWFVGLAMALVIALLAIRVGAMRAGERTGWLVAFIGGMHFAYWFSQPIGTTNDSHGYTNSFGMLLDGYAAYFPPGYPLLVGPVAAVAGDSTGLVVALIQHLLVIVAAAWTYALLRRLVTEELAWVGAALAGSLPAVLAMSQAVMSEVLAIFTMVGTVFYAVRCSEGGRRRDAVAAGLLAGWAVLARVVPLAALVPVVLLLLVRRRERRTWKLAATTLGTMALLVAIPVAHIARTQGEPRLTLAAGYHLFNRVVTEQRQLDPDGPATRRLLALIDQRDPRGIAWWDITALPALDTMPDIVTEPLMRDVALEGLRTAPIEYLLSTPPLAWRELVSDPTGWIPRWGETPIPRPYLETPPLGATTATAIRWRMVLDRLHGMAWPVVCGLAILGVLVELATQRRRLVLAVAWIPAGYLLASAAVEYFAPRHNIPVIPFVVILAMIPLAAVVNLVQRRRETVA